jgi:hypothetical protein
MGIAILSGEKFDGVDFGSACGSGYVIGTTPISELLRVDEAEHAAVIIGMKYYHHPAGDPRGATRPPDSYTRMTMLVSQGRWRQSVWSESGNSVEVLLHRPGDFIAWIPGLWHSWFPEADSTMLTISLKRK